MPQLKMICLAHPATWSDISQDFDHLQQKMVNLQPQCISWLNLNTDRGTRIGIYKVEILSKQNHVLVRFAAETAINEEHKSVEKLLAEDGCLPEGIKIPTPVPRANKLLIFFDLGEGICYAYSPGMAPEQESIFTLLERLQKDTGLPVKTAKIFEWKEELVTTVTEEARRRGFRPYEVMADLETVKVTAKGDLENNENWKKIEGAIDLGTWRTILYVRMAEQGALVFGLTKKRSKQISMPEIEADLPPNELLERILEVRALIEKALGCEVRQYCFPEPVKTLSQFMK